MFPLAVLFAGTTYSTCEDLFYGLGITSFTSKTKFYDQVKEMGLEEKLYRKADETMDDAWDKAIRLCEKQNMRFVPASFDGHWSKRRNSREGVGTLALAIPTEIDGVQSHLILERSAAIRSRIIK